MLAIYGHPFSSYTWKVLIALYASDIPFEFRVVGPDDPDNNAFIAAHSGPLGKFPLLVDGGDVLFESTTIIEYLALHQAGAGTLLPGDPDAANRARMMDRVFDNYVMGPMQAIVDEHLRPEDARDPDRIVAARAKLGKSYAWLDDYPVSPRITLVECAAAPSLHYADLVHPIGTAHPRLRNWLAHLKALPPVRRCLDEAAPYQHFFPVPARERA